MILEIEQLTKEYPGGRRALESIDLAVAPGELVVVLGPNGSPAGQVGMIFQQGNLVHRRSALANVATGSLGRHHDWRTALGSLPREELLQAGMLLDRLGLTHLAHKRADTLSGGGAHLTRSHRAGIGAAAAGAPRG